MKRLLLLAATVAAFAAQAQSFPGTKPVTIVVPFAAGGPTDRVARDLAEAMRKPLGGVSVVVDNAAGAGGSIGANKVAKAAPDGHTLLLHHIGMATMPTLVRNLPFKVESDFEYLGMVNDVPMTLIGRPNLPATTSRNWSPGSTRTRARSTWAMRVWVPPRTCAACCSRTPCTPR